MAQLDYRPVAAPDFSNSIQGVTAANEMIQKAFGTALGTVNQYEGNQRDAASKELLNRMLAIRDPEAYKAALAAGTLTAGIDNRLLGMDDLRSVEARAPQLISQAKNELEFNSFKDADARTRKQLAAKDAAKPIMIDAFMLASNNDLAGANALIAKNMPTVGNLTFDEIKSFVSGNMSQADVSRRFGWGDVDRNWDLTQRGWTLEDRNNSEAAAAAVQDILSRSSNKQDAETNLLKGNYAPKVAAAIRQQLGLEAFPTFAQDPLAGIGTGGGGFGGADPLTIMNYEAKASGFPVVPDSVKTFGQASDFALQVNAANKARMGKPGSSAMGLYQIVGSTMRDYAPAALGANWRNADFKNAANQDKVAQKIWEDNNSSAEKIHKQWTSISVAEAKSLVGKPWNDQIRNAVAKGESGGDAAALVRSALGAAVDAAQTDFNRADRGAAVNTGNIAKVLTATQSDGRDESAAAAAVANWPGFKGGKYTDHLNAIRKIQALAKENKTTVTAATAAEILKASMKPKSLFGTTLTERFTQYDLSPGMGWDYEKATDLIKTTVPTKQADGSMRSFNETVIRGNAATDGQAVLENKARAAITAATNDLARVRGAIAAGRQIELAPYLMRLEQAYNMLGAAQGALKPKPTAVEIPTPPQGKGQTPPAGRDPRFNPNFDAYAASQVLPRGFGVMR